MIITMKKWAYAVLLSGCLAVSLSGCDNKQDEQQGAVNGVENSGGRKARFWKRWSQYIQKQIMMGLQ